MNLDFYVFLVLGLALLFANLPFWSQRVLLVWPWRGEGQKPLWLRLTELVIFYFVVGAIAKAIEHSQGQIYPQGWQFYVVTISLFLTFAFPGFVIRYMLARRT
ncbi:DUF2818 family protein [Serpentinimonas barnesii]|uniref:DUF2818 family protein n=1 Tax=Serpentinimonas barnesii TaxID=1458427 RepID=UPI000494DBC2|nr:DUF2818 family protein [Serpentinimonas barnesii]